MVIVTFLISCATAETADYSTMMGEVREDVYENEYFGLGCELEGWRYDNHNELMVRNKMTYDQLSGEILESVKAGQALFLMFAQTSDMQKNVSVTVSYVENAEALVEIYGMKMIVEALSETMKQSLAQMGRTDVTVSLLETEIGGEVFYGYDVDQGIACTSQIMLAKGNYTFAISATAGSMVLWRKRKRYSSTFI